MKTGFTSGAGYSLASSATQGDMRLIAVVMGSTSPKARESESKQLLSYGFRFFDTIEPNKVGEPIAQPRVWMGDKDNVNVGLAEPLYLTLPKGDIPKLSAVVEMQQDLSAPIEQGAVVGQVMYKLEDQVIAEASLVAQEPVEQGSIFKRLLDWVKKLFASLF